MTKLTALQQNIFAMQASTNSASKRLRRYYFNNNPTATSDAFIDAKIWELEAELNAGPIQFDYSLTNEFYRQLAHFTQYDDGDFAIDGAYDTFDNFFMFLM